MQLLNLAHSRKDLQWSCWFCRRGRRRILIGIAVFAYMGYMTAVFGRWQSQFSSIDDSRRLTEEQSREGRPQIPLRAWLDPPPPLITGKAWNATNIQWVGKSFYFSNDGSNGKSNIGNFQLYTPHQIQKAFRQHSILLQGDSTVRRLYGSMHSILSSDVWTGSTSMDFPKGFPAQVPHPPYGVPATYFVRKGLEAQAKGVNPERLLSMLIHSPAPMDPRFLEHRTIVDVNKEFYTEPCGRSSLFPSSHVMYTPLFGKEGNVVTSFKPSKFEYKVCRTHPTGGWLPPRPMQKGTPISPQNEFPMRTPLLYDYINTNCLGHIHDFVSHELSHQRSITRQYSIFIVGPGVWETVKQHICHHPLYDRMPSSDGQSSQLQWPDTIYHLLKETLDKLTMLAEQSPELLIIWRTSGFYDGDKQSHVLKEMNRRAVQFIHEWNNKNSLMTKKRKSNFLCLDFGSTVEHRSHGRERLRGDMQAHYALEVRVLQFQMLTNLLYENGYVQ